MEIKDENSTLVQPDANGWYPAGCAPERKNILIYTPEWEVENHNFNVGCKTSTGQWIDYYYNNIDSPTHWRPIPNPPVKQVVA